MNSEQAVRKYLLAEKILYFPPHQCSFKLARPLIPRPQMRWSWLCGVGVVVVVVTVTADTQTIHETITVDEARTSLERLCL